MANTIDFILTNAASELISKVLNGKTLNFTRMAVGDGFSYDTTVAKGYTTLVNEVLSLDITKKETLTASSVRITSAFKNTDAQKEFYYREVGLFAQDPDTGKEVLYAYGNRNDAAELIIPSGSSVVTKQLIFIISVGDSANVTFNVNADIYALQEDMIDVQENKADKNLANTGMITNCLLEVPQRIKYELTDGILTIKAGSIVIVPYGTEDLSEIHPVGSNFLNTNYKVHDSQYSDDGKFFVWIELQNDLSISYAIDDTKERLCFIRLENNSINALVTHLSSAESYTGTGNAVHFRTDLNQVHQLMNKEITTTNNSLPFLIVRADGTNIYGSVSQVFNGFGYIGSTVWVDKGVKGLIPNGIDPNGNVNNIFYESSNISFFQKNNDGVHPIIIGPDFGLNIDYKSYVDSEKMPLTIWTIWHNRITNIISASFETVGLFRVPQVFCVYCGTVSVKSGIIESINIKRPLQIIDYNDYIDRIEKLESRISALETISSS